MGIRIFDVKGSLVKVLLEGPRPSGPGSIMWDGTNDQGKGASSGIYFYEARTADKVQVNKLALVK